MDRDQKQTNSSALRTLTNDKSVNNNNKQNPRQITSSQPKRKRKPVKYNDDSDYSDIDEEHVVKSDSEDEFKAEQKKKKQKKKKQKKSQSQVASTSLVAPAEPTNINDKKKAATKKKKEIALVYNTAMNKFHDILNKDKKANGFIVRQPTIKQATVKITLRQKPISSKVLNFDEQDTILVSEAAWIQDRAKAIVINYNELNESEKLPFLNRIRQDPASWVDYSSLTPATQKLWNTLGNNNSNLNFPIEKDFLSMRQKEVTSRGLADQPSFNTSRKNSFIRQIVTTITGEINKSSKPKAKKQKATFKLQSTTDRASEAIANNRPQDVIMKKNHWKEFASYRTK